MTRDVTVATTQMHCTWNIKENIQRAEKLIREAHSKGANIVLLQELFMAPYFCIDQDMRHLELAQSVDDSPLIKHFQALAKELGVVLPISFFEKANHAYFNSLVVIDADGSVLDVYRKTQIPNDFGYQEKQYFTPGDTGYRVWDTKFCRIGVGICWDQWFPETQRSLALMGAELIFHPTAIGSEPGEGVGAYDSQPHWTRVQQGAAGANMTPVIAANRIGTEQSKFNKNLEITFYGSSFIADQTGALVAQADKVTEGVLLHTFDLDAIAKQRDWWGIFRDRRPEMYNMISSSDGKKIFSVTRGQ